MVGKTAPQEAPQTTTAQTGRKTVSANPENPYGPTQKQLDALHNIAIWMTARQVSDKITEMFALRQAGLAYYNSKKAAAAEAPAEDKTSA